MASSFPRGSSSFVTEEYSDLSPSALELVLSSSQGSMLFPPSSTPISSQLASPFVPPTAFHLTPVLAFGPPPLSLGRPSSPLLAAYPLPDIHSDPSLLTTPPPTTRRVRARLLDSYPDPSLATHSLHARHTPISTSFPMRTSPPPPASSPIAASPSILLDSASTSQPQSPPHPHPPSLTAARYSTS
ncbi:hypothetical protein KP509_14G033800 [Ceratopteris richardii]|uniref:Uncharacterized protein n=1 Tax=Ceratopteris richardii TaxID=49495 RepID=A0A8T2T702_CERRI|nr:hypothetical protein KP509_14G033800 [Ceratopteris richardii]